MHKRKQTHTNALKHGAFSKIAIIPGEDPQEFEELHSALIEEWKPVGPTEEDTVLSIAKGIWRKRRLQKIFAAGIRSDMMTNPKHPTYDEAFALEWFYEVISDGMIDDLGSAFVVLKPITADHLRQKYPRQNFQTELEWIRALQKEVSLVLLPAVKDRLKPESEVYLTEYLNDGAKGAFWGTEIGVDARIDANIDRAVKRLVQIKAVKQIMGTTSANAGSEPPKKLLPEGSAKIVSKRQNGRRSHSPRGATEPPRADPPSS